MAQAAFLPSGDFPKVVDKSRLQAKNQPKVGRKTSISADLWSEWRGSNSRPPHPKRIYDGTFRRKWLFPPLSAWKTALFATLMSTVSECSETVGGLLCGQRQFPRNNMSYTPPAFTRGAIACCSIIITLNDSLFKLILCRLLATGCAATKYGVLYYQ